MEGSVFHEALREVKEDTELFDGDEKAIHDFSIALINGYEAAERADEQHEEDVVDSLVQARAVLRPVAFPRPAPRTLRAVGFVLGCVQFHLLSRHADEAFREQLRLAVAESVRSLEEWEALADVFEQLFASVVKS